MINGMVPDTSNHRMSETVNRQHFNWLKQQSRLKDCLNYSEEFETIDLIKGQSRLKDCLNYNVDSLR